MTAHGPGTGGPCWISSESPRLGGPGSRPRSSTGGCYVPVMAGPGGRTPRCRDAGEDLDVVLGRVARWYRVAACRRWCRCRCRCARPLLVAALGLARARGATRVFVQTTDDDDAALTLYRSAGFTRHHHSGTTDRH
jgi:hypothetical protein